MLLFRVICSSRAPQHANNPSTSDFLQPSCHLYPVATALSIAMASCSSSSALCANTRHALDVGSQVWWTPCQQWQKEVLRQRHQGSKGRRLGFGPFQQEVHGRGIPNELPDLKAMVFDRRGAGNFRQAHQSKVRNSTIRGLGLPRPQLPWICRECMYTVSVFGMQGRR